jgi:hypothetical protein
MWHAIPIGDGLQPCHQALHEVHPVLPSYQIYAKNDFIDKFTVTYFYALQFVFFHQVLFKNCFSGFGVKAFLDVFYPKNVQVSIFCAKPCKKILVS